MVKTKIDVEKLAQEIVENFSGGLTGKEYNQAYVYALHWLPSLLEETEEAKRLDLSVEAYAEASIHNGLSDGDHKEFDGSGIIIQKPEEQEIIEVDQETVKKALKELSVNDDNKISEKLALYYKTHEEVNKKFFDGKLSHPLITITKLNNRTLGNYTEGKDAMNIENHIRLNVNFVALNSDERVLETLKHEMIHQWQDEILYLPRGYKGAPKMVKYPVTEKAGLDKFGKDTYRFTGEWKEIPQKRRPKDWHNRDFKDMASVLGIPAWGDKCYGNEAKMPEPKSYNRKFVCGCVASNGYPLTVWSTRKVVATCDICGQKFREVPKGGKVIQVKQSHIEKQGEDAVFNEKSKQFAYFERFETREDREAFVDGLKGVTKIEEGVYQKYHNAYKDGFRYWVAYTLENPKKTGKKVAKPKKKETKKMKQVEQEQPKKIEKKERSHKNPKDLIILYRELGSAKRVAEELGVTPATITNQKKKFNIDFGKGTYEDDGKVITV